MKVKVVYIEQEKAKRINEILEAEKEFAKNEKEGNMNNKRKNY